MRVARPNATPYEIGTVFSKDGRAGSGIFINGELAYPCDPTNKAIVNDFESINGRYRNNGYSEFFGELNLENKPHGRGVKITSGEIFIGNFCSGGTAPGNYLVLYRGGELKMGQIYEEGG